MHANRYSKRTLEPVGESIDVKIDSGGIRDIEFLVQCLQRVYGGEEPWLRAGGTLFSLQKLHDKRHISGKEFHDLTGAYEFLRRVQSSLGRRENKNVSVLPANSIEQRNLANRLGCGADFATTYSHSRNTIASLYRRYLKDSS